MRKLIISFTLPALLLAGGCGAESGSESDTPALASESVEQYPLRGVVEGKDASANALTVRHEDVPGLMDGMTMSFRVEGAEVASLPEIGQGVEATLNVGGPDYWLTEVRAAEIPPSLIEPAADTTASDTAGAVGETATDTTSTSTAAPAP